MSAQGTYITRVAATVALGGFLMGFDASVISGVVGFIEAEFQLGKLALGWAVASLTLSASLAMLMAGPLSDRLGRRPVLKLAAALFAVSAIASALAPDFLTLVIARMVGGIGVGAALIVAPMFIAEIAPAKARGRLVSFNQLNIVIGISAAFFSNYLIIQLGDSSASWAEALRFGELPWRWMLGVETLPTLAYLLGLLMVPESPRWLAMRGRDEEALEVLARVGERTEAEQSLRTLHGEFGEGEAQRLPWSALFAPSLRLALTIGVVIAVLQQVSGINAIFFYAPMIFAQTGVGADAAFAQAVLVGLVNLVFTLVAMAFIDRLGRRPLLLGGLAGVAVSMLVLAGSFGAATYRLEAAALESLPAQVDTTALGPLVDVEFDSDLAFKQALVEALGEEAATAQEQPLVSAAIRANSRVILIAILAFVASFALSLGPIMWVLFSELFPNRLRALAVSCVGLINSAVSFLVQLVFPWELAHLGSSATFALYGACAVVGFVFVLRVLPETRGRSLEEVSASLMRV